MEEDLGLALDQLDSFKWPLVNLNSFQGLGALRGKINLDYDVSPNPFQRHRALYLYSPTTEMTGDYTCKVSTLQNEVTLSKKMVVYGKTETYGKGEKGSVQLSAFRQWL